MNLPRFALQVRSDTGWKTVRTFDSLEEAGRWIVPGGCVVPTVIPPTPCRSGVVKILMLFAFLTGFSAAAVLMRGGVL